MRTRKQRGKRLDGGGRVIAAEGAQELAARLEEIRESVLIAAAVQGMQSGLEQIAQDARAACPVESGALKASIRVRAARSGETAAGEIRAGASYAAAVELGTMRRRARPFLYPAYKAGQARLAEETAEAVRRALGER